MRNCGESFGPLKREAAGIYPRQSVTPLERQVQFYRRLGVQGEALDVITLRIGGYSLDQISSLLQISRSKCNKLLCKTRALAQRHDPYLDDDHESDSARLRELQEIGHLLHGDVSEVIVREHCIGDVQHDPSVAWQGIVRAVVTVRWRSPTIGPPVAAGLMDEQGRPVFPRVRAWLPEDSLIA